MPEDDHEIPKDALRQALWNVVRDEVFKPAEEDRRQQRYESFAIYMEMTLWQKYLLPGNSPANLVAAEGDPMADYFLNCTWNEACEFLEDIAEAFGEEFCQECNVLLEREQSSFRFVRMKLAAQAVPDRRAPDTREG
jgi:hypothetical protein